MADPQQADPVTTLFNTSKTISQYQGGLVLDQALTSGTSVRLTGFGGRRMIEQFLALTGAAPTSSGGVVDLDRNYGGFGARLAWKGTVAGRPLTLNVGADVARQKEHRQGFVNNFGVIGDLRRDEDDTPRGRGRVGCRAAPRLHGARELHLPARTCWSLVIATADPGRSARGQRR